MRIDQRRLNWGVFLIILGAVPLAWHAGAIPTSAVADAWRLWPLILIGLGLGVILARTPAAFLGGLIVASMMGVVVGGALSAGPNVGCGNGHNQATTTRDGTFSGSATITLNLQCGSATVGASQDASWHVSAVNDAGHTPTIAASATSLSVTSYNGGWWPDRGAETWQVLLPADTTVSLTSTLDFGDAHLALGGAKLSAATVTLNMGSVHVDLTGATVGRLSLSTNLGKAWLELDSSSNLVGDVSTSLGSLDVCAPASLGLRIKSSESLASSDMGALGMTLAGDSWQTPNYATAEHRANLTVSTSLGSLKLHSAGGCK